MLSMSNLPINRIERTIAKLIPEEHRLSDSVGFFVGLSPTNPLVRYRFSESSILVEDNRKVSLASVVDAFKTGVDPLQASQAMKESFEIPYADIVSVTLPNTVNQPPAVTVLAEGYLMVHTAQLTTLSGTVEVCGGVLNGKSDVYVWASVVNAIRSERPT